MADIEDTKEMNVVNLFTKKPLPVEEEASTEKIKENLLSFLGCEQLLVIGVRQDKKDTDKYYSELFRICDIPESLWLLEMAKKRILDNSMY